MYIYIYIYKFAVQLQCNVNFKMGGDMILMKYHQK